MSFLLNPKSFRAKKKHFNEGFYFYLHKVISDCAKMHYIRVCTEERHLFSLCERKGIPTKKNERNKCAACIYAFECT